MNPDEALSKLNRAVARRDRTAAASNDAREALYSVIRDIAPHVKQADIVRRTGWTREHIRKIVKADR